MDYGNEAIAKRRKTSTQMTQCPFRFVLKLDSTWSVTCPARDFHNHPFIEPMAHAKYKGEVISRYAPDIIRAYNNGLRPVLIAAQLRERSHEDPDLVSVTPKQIYNILARHRQEELAGRTPLQFLYDKPQKSDFLVRDAHDQAGRL